ncbi:YopX family protein, partial [Intestinibacter bartlettii]
VNDKKKVAKNLWSETDVNRVIGNIYENKELLEVE